jgi:release factor H-coupled RctB family protein
MKSIKLKIKNKFRVKATRIFLENGIELDDSNISLIKNDTNIVFTKGADYKCTTKILNKDVPIKIIAENTYISSDAIKQLTKASQTMNDIVYSFGMPDLDVGSPCPIGSVIFTKNIIHPSLIGSDIGCGMALFQTDIKRESINFQKVAKRLKSIDGPMRLQSEDYSDDCFISDMIEKNNIHNQDYNDLLGTVGHGNHFAEVQKITKVVNKEVFDKYGFKDSVYYLLVHSGSRGYGFNLLQKYKSEELEGEKLDEYLENHDDALNWAKLNRELIAERLLDQIKVSCNYEKKIDIFQNFVERRDYINSKQMYWIHRKGATPADRGLVVIPGSRGSYSYLVNPIKKAIDNLEECGYSLSHGAGRYLTRGKALSMKSDKNSKFILENDFDNVIICDNNDLLYEESPKAYKDINIIIDDLVKEGLCEIIAVLEPVLTYKTKNQR